MQALVTKEEADALRARGYRIAHPGECMALAEPTAARAEPFDATDAAPAASVRA